MTLTLKNKKIKISFDYITVAFICIMIICGNDTKYLTAMLCTVIHECGHIVVMLRHGRGQIDVSVNLFNIAISDKDRNCRSYREDIMIICAGPLANILTAAVFGIIYVFFPDSRIFDTVMISIALAVFNLLPMESTDGGQLLYIFLCRRIPQQTARRIMTVITLIVLVPVAALGFFVLLQSKYNYTLLFSAMYLAALIIIRNDK